MTHESELAVEGADGAAGVLGCAWAAVKIKQPTAYKLQWGLFLTRMAITFNSHGFIGYQQNKSTSGSFTWAIYDHYFALIYAAL
jgi:hypothetical protein